MLSKNILIVEDDPDNQELLKEIIDSCPDSYNHESVNTGEEALKHLENNNYDLVIMDVGMPQKDGYEIIKQIRKTSTYNKTPIVALTAHAMKGVKEKVLESGFNEYLSKPCLPKDIKSTIIKYLENKQKILLG